MNDEDAMMQFLSDLKHSNDASISQISDLSVQLREFQQYLQQAQKSSDRMNRAASYVETSTQAATSASEAALAASQRLRIGNAALWFTLALSPALALFLMVASDFIVISPNTLWSNSEHCKELGGRSGVANGQRFCAFMEPDSN